LIQGLLILGFLLALWQIVSSIRGLPRGVEQRESMRRAASMTETTDSIPHVPGRAKTQSGAISR
jgi:hypothetical protein